MALRWVEFQRGAPTLAGVGQARFERDRLALIGTLRKDGSPRISPVEPYLAAGHLLLGMEWPTSKARDLIRDSRCVLHSVATDPEGVDGEFKLYGRATPVTDPSVLGAAHDAWWLGRRPDSYRVFEMEIESAAFIAWDPNGKEMRLVRWHPGGGETEEKRQRPS